jgi:hypothetical protein
MAAVRVLDECEQPRITTWLGSGICGRPLLVQLQRATHDHGREQAWTWM